MHENMRFKGGPGDKEYREKVMANCTDLSFLKQSKKPLPRE